MSGPRPLATLLAVALLLGGGLLGAIIGNWLLPLLIVVANPGRGGVESIPIEGLCFANPPEWLKAVNHPLFTGLKLGTVVLGMTALVGGAGMGQRLWRYLMVKKLGWMTDEEVDDFWKRDPGF